MAADKAYVLVVGPDRPNSLGETHRELSLFNGMSAFIPKEQPQHPMEIVDGDDVSWYFEEIEPKLRRQFDLKEIGYLYRHPTGIHFMWLLLGMTYRHLFDDTAESTDSGLIDLECKVLYREDSALLNVVVPDLCICGRSHDAIRMFYNALRAHLGNPIDGDEGSKEIRKSYGGGNSKDDLAGAMQFIYWVIDARELAEHGSSAPGWLTFKGQIVLALLHDYLHGEKETTDG